MPARAPSAARLSAACLGLALVGLAFGLYKIRVPPGPVGEEATQVMMAQSLWHERDLTYDHRDLLRAYRVWERGPSGLVLASADGGRSMHYGEPFLYALAALPFYAALGVRGLLVFNMALWLAMVAAAWVHWRRAAGGPGGSGGMPGPGWAAGGLAGLPGPAALFVLGGFFASAAFAYVFRLESEVFAMAGGFLPLVAWLHLRRRPALRDRDLWLLAGAGVLLAAAALVRPQIALLVAPVALDLLRGRRWAGLAAFLAGTLLCLAGTAAVERRLTGGWPWSPAGERRAFRDEFPIESGRNLWQAPVTPLTSAEDPRPPLATGLRLLPRNFGYFLYGRHAGLLPYFPFALLAVALYLGGPRDGARHLLGISLLAACLALLAVYPGDWHGGIEALGNRRFAVLYPALLLLPRRIRWPRALVLTFAAAGLWTIPAAGWPLEPRAPEPNPAVHVRTRPFQALPLELTLLHRLPGNAFGTWGGATWIVPRHTFSTEEQHPNGVWVKGATRSTVVVVAREPLDEVRFRASSLSADNELILDSGVERVRVRFDSEGKRRGTPITLAVQPSAIGLGFPPGGPPMSFYELILTTTDGVIPARRVPGSTDPRYLGVFLDFTGGGPEEPAR